jgi:hypothetical protein
MDIFYLLNQLVQSLIVTYVSLFILILFTDRSQLKMHKQLITNSNHYVCKYSVLSRVQTSAMVLVLKRESNVQED